MSTIGDAFRAVFWSFFGVRKHNEYEKDSQRLTPQQRPHERHRHAAHQESPDPGVPQRTLHRTSFSRIALGSGSNS